MHMDAILRITAILQANADAKRATDKHRLVDGLELEFPLITREVLLALVESSITLIDGTTG
jgi:hypothetical protein